MAAMTKITPPIASNVPEKERRLIAGFGALGSDVDMVDNDAEDLFIVFILREWHR